LNLVDKPVSAQSLVSDSQFKHLAKLEAERSFVEKTGLDYSYALQDCYYSSSSPFIALFEGDILVADGWLARAILGLKTIVKHFVQTKEPWLDMRLFNPEQNIGWASSSILGNNELFIAAGISAIVVIIVILFRLYTSYPTLSNSALCFICLVSIPSVVILFYQTGKSSLFHPRPGVTVEGWGCCTQAFILSRDQVPGMIAEFRNKAGTLPADSIVHQYTLNHSLKRYVMNPVQVQHMGKKIMKQQTELC
jgi:hypothetical protein